MQIIKKITVIGALVGCGALAGCVSGTAEFTDMNGRSVSRENPTVRMARARCNMRTSDKTAQQQMAYGVVVINDVIDDAYQCFTAEGYPLKGFRQNDGRLTRYPFANTPDIEGNIGRAKGAK